jgi:phosphohistidine swiveling domain-containing protein
MKLAGLINNDTETQQDYFEKNIDWVVYLERKQPLFLFASFVRPYGSKLKEATGFGFVRQLYYFKDDTGFFYRSAIEMKNADEYYLTLIKNKDKRLPLWQKLGIQHNVAADSLIKRFSGGQFISKDIAAEYNKIQEQCEEIMMYGTVIPYRILSAVNSAIEAGESDKNFQDVLTLFEPLRATTKYPSLVENVFPVFWKAAAEIAGVKDHDVFSLLDPDELGEVFNNPADFDRKKIEQRKYGCVFWVDQELKHFMFSTDPYFLENNGISINSTQDVSQLKGNIANKGVARGYARIINNLKDAHEFSDGNIVVSINTSPSLMPILIKCSGIVTDEGGIMCHAAIVSRELNKPCIIGTKVATKVIKNGDLIEIDANKGTVTILKRE